MKIVIENVRPEYLHKVVRFLKRDLSRSLKIANVEVEAMWVTFAEHGPITNQELREVVTFELGDEIIGFDSRPYPTDWAMRVLTNVFEGSNLDFSAPDNPGFRWTIG
ncbi:MAG: hypothetical protein HYT47_02565 [Candidatus Vogelbacteria bacterium]|nr:hypothetical protein [Candidatus Vogelbacteria bacterium]